jgi:xanthine dehydrogenase accessory factor
MSSSLHLLVLGSGEIARTLVALANHLNYTITVCDEQLETESWPANVKLINNHFSNAPWSLADHTHAIIARGHEEDVQSLVNLLNNDAENVYLIASARRAQTVIDEATPLLKDVTTLAKLSAPAGLELGGNSTAEICLSILAEVQWHCHNCSTSLRPLTELRTSRLDKSISGQRNKSCPGKRV